MADWLAVFVAGIALVVSVLTAAEAYVHRRRDARTANLTAYFHWNEELSRVHLTDGQVLKVGYNLVVWNQGPATAEDVRIEVRSPRGDAVELASVEATEFPLRRIDPAGRYPIQFAPVSPEFRSGDERPVVRRFDVHLTWRDGNGKKEHVVPLRRGQVRI